MNTAKKDVAELVKYAVGRLGERLEGLTDEEYFWAPVPDCWSVRQVDGEWRADVAEDGSSFAPDPQPFTTIAWRLWHLGASPERPWPPGPKQFLHDYFAEIPLPARTPYGTAAEAAAAVVRDWSQLAATVESWDDDEMMRPMGPVAHRFADASSLALALHLADELIHHGAEIALLRDLYAHRGQ